MKVLTLTSWDPSQSLRSGWVNIIDKKNELISGGCDWLPGSQLSWKGMHFFFFWLFLFFLGPQPQHMEVPRPGSNWSCSCGPTPQPQQHGIPAASVIYIAHGNARSFTHWSRPGIEPASSWILVGFINHWAMTRTPKEGNAFWGRGSLLWLLEFQAQIILSISHYFRLPLAHPQGEDICPVNRCPEVQACAILI